MCDASNDKSWPYQEFHDSNKSSNESSRSSQVNWGSKIYHYLGEDIQITKKEGRGLLKQPSSSINVVRIDWKGAVCDNVYRQY
ncbi:hypothetical protein [Wolbachia endosymbiont of Folsomia candida]|uniref:hypothetical protein n=1 Tax=Wolbachia endosymbiont of Folsomia candida TaxID=169402 RepID=UPI000A6769A7|nr:hypothetical protein [Wolbachia endosymbiont of Folsomia candida]APR98884.1 hypothetical protein ASM33_06720 [Wolbachia endosymbiont of Folsomia candida]